MPSAMGVLQKELEARKRCYHEKILRGLYGTHPGWDDGTQGDQESSYCSRLKYRKPSLPACDEIERYAVVPKYPDEPVFSRLAPRLRNAPIAILLFASFGWWWLRGAAPGSAEFTLSAYRADAYTRSARAQAQALKGQDRVVCDYRLLAHLAERPEPLLDPSQRLYWKKTSPK